MRKTMTLQFFADAGEAASAPAAEPAVPAAEPAPADAGETAQNAPAPPPAAEPRKAEAVPESSADVPEASAAETDGKETQAGPQDLPVEALLLRMRQQQRAVRAQRILSDWEAEAAEIRKTYPDFDLQRSFAEDGAFSALVRAGLPLKKAYEAAHLDEILTAAMGYAVRRGGQMTADALRGGAARPQENSVLDRASSLKTTDVNSLTQKEILRIIGEVGKGAKITFR